MWRDQGHCDSGRTALQIETSPLGGGGGEGGFSSTMFGIPAGKVVAIVTSSDIPPALALKGITSNVYWVLGMRPEAVNVLVSVPVTISVVLIEVKVGPKVTLYPIISLFLSMHMIRSHWTVTALGVGVAIKFCTLLLGAVRGRIIKQCGVCMLTCGQSGGY